MKSYHFNGLFLNNFLHVFLIAWLWIITKAETYSKQQPNINVDVTDGF